jgi:hypothetical protein
VRCTFSGRSIEDLVKELEILLDQAKTLQIVLDEIDILANDSLNNEEVLYDGTTELED